MVFKRKKHKSLSKKGLALNKIIKFKKKTPIVERPSVKVSLEKNSIYKSLQKVLQFFKTKEEKVKSLQTLCLKLQEEVKKPQVEKNQAKPEPVPDKNFKTSFADYDILNITDINKLKQILVNASLDPVLRSKLETILAKLLEKLEKQKLASNSLSKENWSLDLKQKTTKEQVSNEEIILVPSPLMDKIMQCLIREKRNTALLAEIRAIIKKDHQSRLEKLQNKKFQQEYSSRQLSL